jgi:choline dehydrogenase-like flavoprotein
VDGDFRRYRPAAVIELWNPGFGPEFYSSVFAQLGYFGKDLAHKVRRFYGTDVDITAPFDCLPYESNRITLNESVVDQFGMPVPNVHFNFTDYEMKGAKFIVKYIEQLVYKAGGIVTHGRHNILNGNHPMGTTRMGSNPAASVISDRLQAHDHPNLFVPGGGAMTTGGAVNPSMTIGALTLRALPEMRKVLRG